MLDKIVNGLSSILFPESSLRVDWDRVDWDLFPMSLIPQSVLEAEVERRRDAPVDGTASDVSPESDLPPKTRAVLGLDEKKRGGLRLVRRARKVST